MCLTHKRIQELTLFCMLRSIQGHDNAKNNHLVTSLLLSSGFWSDYLSSMGTGAIRGLQKWRLMSTYNDWYSKFQTQPAAISILDIFVEYGNEGSIVLLQACLDQVKFQSEDFQSKLDLPSPIFRYFLGRPNFATVFCEALRSKVMSGGFLGLSKQLHLSTPEKIAVGLALSNSGNTDFRIRGKLS
ncbi:uncharacterized protein LOC131247311 isoform X2 [Magnolia sinica]|uniref:uncharacterized protein LOC131247311 isoform X2 n=1 Tax=Magnolia sinica TaxID=86752 RepID=UPI002657BF9A|nr:uncharacterized protein LOC131247311 isoform X2 [Magnolia sinica]